jgi:hypothetical protein
VVSVYVPLLSHRIYRETKIYLIKGITPHLHKGPPSGQASTLGYFNRGGFKLQIFSWERRTRYLDYKAKRYKIDQGYSGWMAAARCT